ncbi:MAG: macro domain-containing protein [Patescibacteria group bacterium]
MRVIVSDIERRVLEAVRREFEDNAGFGFHPGSILDVECDAVVSPANSFGFMDGGIDLVYSERFGWDLQKRLQEIIRQRHHGELLVGDAAIVETGDKRIPYLIAAPTMRVPSNIEETVNVYLATRAVFLLLEYGRLEDDRAVKDVIETIAMPGMGTGIGRVSPRVCARQMKEAYLVVYGKGAGFPAMLGDAFKHHERMISGLRRCG